MGDDAKSIADREEIRTARKALKMVRKTCKEYKMGFHMPIGVFSMKKEKREASSSDESESSLSDVSSEDDKNALGHHASWKDVRGMLDNLQPSARVKLLHDINRSLSDSAIKAGRHLELLDEKKTEKPETEEDSDEDPLLHFSAAEMPVAHALRRCARIVPALKEQALIKIREKEAAKAEYEKRKAMASEYNVDQFADADQQEGLAREVAKKLYSYGTLPPDADPDLHKVLFAQKTEIHAVVQRIIEAEKHEQVIQLTQKYIEGNLNADECDQDLLAAALENARTMKAELLETRKEEAKRQYYEDRSSLQVPTDEEVREQQEECERLQNEVATAHERIRRLQEMESLAGQQADESAQQMTATISERGEGRQRRKARVGVLQAAPKIGFSIENAPQIHKELSEEVADLEEQVTHEEKRIEYAQGIMRNIEQTLKTLEETKTCFLEQVAVERPMLLADLLEIGESEDGSDGEQDDEEDEDVAVSAVPTEETKVIEVEETDQMDNLRAEERWIRNELQRVHEDIMDLQSQLPRLPELPTSATTPRHASIEGINEMEDANEWRNDPLVQDVQKLVDRIETVCRRACSNEKAEDSSDDDAELDNGLTPEMAVEQLKALPHKHLRDVIRTREENERLLEKINREQIELEHLRSELGNPQELLKPGSTAEAPEDVPPELLNEVRRKCRELHALRKKWWSDRQDPMTTVRRTLAGARLPENLQDEDEPPKDLVESLFVRIHSSMTIP